MHRIAALMLSAVLIGAPASAMAGNPDSAYRAMVTAAQSGAPGVDYGKLRRAYAESPGYDPYGLTVGDLFDKMVQAYSAGDCSAATKDAATISAKQFTEIEAHLIATLCFEKSHAKAKAARERAIFTGLTGSILDSGDGVTPKTAYRVVSLDEEYFVLHLLKLNIGQQALVQGGGHAYDRFTVSAKGLPEGAAIFFEIDPIMAADKKSLQ